MVTTHCLPSGSLGTNELAVPTVCAADLTTFTPTGLKRGVVVFMSGLNSNLANATIPKPVTGGSLTFANALQTDGWVVLGFPPYAEDLQAAPQQALFNDVNVDTGHGSRYLTQLYHWWDHVVLFIKANYGNWPIVPFGISWGGWHSHMIAAQYASSIAAYGSHAAVTHLDQLFFPTLNLITVDFTATNSTGLNTSATGLNAIGKPGAVGWDTSDPVITPANLSTLTTNAINAGQSISIYNTSGQGHSFQDADATHYASWFTSTVDPSYPKAF